MHDSKYISCIPVKGALYYKHILLEVYLMCSYRKGSFFDTLVTKLRNGASLESLKVEYSWCSHIDKLLKDAQRCCDKGSQPS